MMLLVIGLGSWPNREMFCNTSGRFTQAISTCNFCKRFEAPTLNKAELMRLYFAKL